MASEVITWFGGSCCVPSACRNMLSTTATRTKQVVIKRIAGARLSTVSSSITWIVELSPSGLTHFSGPAERPCGKLSVSGRLPRILGPGRRGSQGTGQNQRQRKQPHQTEPALARVRRQFAICNLQFSICNFSLSGMFFLPAVPLPPRAGGLEIIEFRRLAGCRGPTAERPGERPSWRSSDGPAGRCRRCDRPPADRSLR